MSRAKWKATAPKLTDGLSAEEIRREFNIYHPISTSVSMSVADGKKLLVRLSGRFGAQPGAAVDRPQAAGR